MASGFALDNYFFQTDSTLKFYNPPGTSYTLVGVNIDGVSIVVNSQGQLQAIAAVAETVYPLTAASGKYELLYDNATLTLNSSNQLALNLANANTWITGQNYSVPANNSYWIGFINSSNGSGVGAIWNDASGANVNIGLLNTSGSFMVWQSASAPVFGVDYQGNVFLNGTIKPNISTSTLTGTTAGNITYSMPFAGSSYKKFIAYANGYENDTTTAQTITFPVAFTNTPLVTGNSSGLSVSVSTTTLTINAPDNTTTYTGWIIVEGY